MNSGEQPDYKRKRVEADAKLRSELVRDAQAIIQTATEDRDFGVLGRIRNMVKDMEATVEDNVAAVRLLDTQIETRRVQGHARRTERRYRKR